MVMLEKTFVVLSYIASLVVNGLAASGVLSGQSIGEISDQFPTYVTPDGLTFAASQRLLGRLCKFGTP